MKSAQPSFIKNFTKILYTFFVIMIVSVNNLLAMSPKQKCIQDVDDSTFSMWRKGKRTEPMFLSMMSDMEKRINNDEETLNKYKTEVFKKIQNDEKNYKLSEDQSISINGLSATYAQCGDKTLQNCNKDLYDAWCYYSAEEKYNEYWRTQECLKLSDADEGGTQNDISRSLIQKSTTSTNTENKGKTKLENTSTQVCGEGEVYVKHMLNKCIPNECKDDVSNILGMATTLQKYDFSLQTPGDPYGARRMGNANVLFNKSCENILEPIIQFYDEQCLNWVKTRDNFERGGPGFSNVPNNPKLGMLKCTIHECRDTHTLQNNKCVPKTTSTSANNQGNPGSSQAQSGGQSQEQQGSATPPKQKEKEDAKKEKEAKKLEEKCKNEAMALIAASNVPHLPLASVTYSRECEKKINHAIGKYKKSGEIKGGKRGSGYGQDRHVFEAEVVKLSNCENEQEKECTLENKIIKCWTGNGYVFDETGTKCVLQNEQSEKAKPATDNNKDKEKSKPKTTTTTKSPSSANTMFDEDFCVQFLQKEKLYGGNNFVCEQNETFQQCAKRLDCGGTANCDNFVTKCKQKELASIKSQIKERAEQINNARTLDGTNDYSVEFTEAFLTISDIKNNEIKQYSEACKNARPSIKVKNDGNDTFKASMKNIENTTNPPKMKLTCEPAKSDEKQAKEKAKEEAQKKKEEEKKKKQQAKQPEDKSCDTLCLIEQKTEQIKQIDNTKKRNGKKADKYEVAVESSLLDENANKDNKIVKAIGLYKQACVEKGYVVKPDPIGGTPPMSQISCVKSENSTTNNQNDEEEEVEEETEEPEEITEDVFKDLAPMDEMIITGDKVIFKAEYKDCPTPCAKTLFTSACDKLPGRSGTNIKEVKTVENSELGEPTKFIYQCQITECEDGFEQDDFGTVCKAISDITENTDNRTEEEKAADLKKLEDDYQAKKENEQSLANRTLTSASIAATGLGAMELARGLSEQKADKAAEQDMDAYIQTMRCTYGNGTQVKAGPERIELPGGNNPELMKLRAEYFALAASLKERKAALGLPPGIESEVILDKSQIGLYDDENVGITGGSYESLYRAKALGSESDQQKISEQQSASKKRVVGGAIATGVGVVGSMVGNAIINGKNNKPNTTDDKEKPAETEEGDEDEDVLDEIIDKTCQTDKTWHTMIDDKCKRIYGYTDYQGICEDDDKEKCLAKDKPGTFSYYKNENVETFDAECEQLDDGKFYCKCEYPGDTQRKMDFISSSNSIYKEIDTKMGTEKNVNADVSTESGCETYCPRLCSVNYAGYINDTLKCNIDEIMIGESGCVKKTMSFYPAPYACTQQGGTWNKNGNTCKCTGSKIWKTDSQKCEMPNTNETTSGQNILQQGGIKWSTDDFIKSTAQTVSNFVTSVK